jgi:hypothetical protein
MTQTLIVCGYGPGISTSVAEKFGAEGFSIALVARNAEKLQNGVKALEAKGIKAAAITAVAAAPRAARVRVWHLMSRGRGPRGGDVTPSQEHFGQTLGLWGVEPGDFAQRAFPLSLEQAVDEPGHPRDVVEGVADHDLHLLGHDGA